MNIKRIRDMKGSRMRQIIQQAINQTDDLVVEFQYRDSKGKLTRRVVSPIRFIGDRFLGLCLSREAPRQFYLERCEQVQLKPAWDYVMPVQFPAIPDAGINVACPSG